MKKFREEFTVYQDENGEVFASQNKDNSLKELKLAVQRPTHLQRQDADFEYNKYMNKLLKEGILPIVKLEQTVRENGIWTEDKEKKERELTNAVIKAEETLRKGKIKLSEAEKIAKQAIKDKFERLSLIMEKNSVLENSAERLAENYRFNYLVSHCTVYNDSGGKRYFQDYDDFLKQDTFGSPVPYLAGMKFSRLTANLEEDFRADWPEYKFLKKYGFVNDKFQLVNKDGKLVGDDGQELSLVEDEPETQEEPEFLPD